MTSQPRAGLRRSSRPLDRLQLRIFAEGRKTESIYLTNWHRLYRDRVIISMAAQGSQARTRSQAPHPHGGWVPVKSDVYRKGAAG
jgi:hypothetical protein